MNCRACGSIELIEFLDLGEQYISDFRSDNSKPNKYPMVVLFCDDCKLVQLKDSPPQKEMYHSNYGFKSGISNSVIIDLDDIVTHAFQYVNDPKTWLDIGSNDGTLLSFIPSDVYRVGVDPVDFLCAEAEEHADLIINDFFNEDVGGEYDVITTVSCFYDMPDLPKFVADVNDVLADKGIWVIQQNYLLTTIELGAIDNFVHEHLTYFNLYPLEKLLRRFGLEVNEVYTSNVNGGSIRTIVSRKDNYPVDKSVYDQRKVEKLANVTSLNTYKKFSDRMGENLEHLKRIISGIKSEDKTICILAASTRGAAIWQALNLGPKEIEYAVERNPAKVGKMFSAVGVPIVSERFFREHKPDYALVGPWFFGNEIIDREKDYIDDGGKLIIPLPEVQIVGN